MTEHLDHCESVLTPMCLHATALRYISRELRTNLHVGSFQYPKGLVKENGEAVLQTMFNKSRINMRVYGSAKELAENIKIYSNFPGNHRYFEVDQYPFSTTPTIYQSLKNQKFISKSDLFVMLQSMVARTSELPDDLLIISIIAYFLKSQEKRVRGHIEFVPFDQQVFDEIWNKIRNIPKGFDEIAKGKGFITLMKEVKSLNVDGVMQKLKSTIPGTWNDKEEKEITSIIKSLHKSQNFAKFIALGLTRISMLISVLQEVINASPEMFLPHFETKDNKLPNTIRIFEDGDQKFVMKDELLSALKIVHGFEADNEDYRVFYPTMKMEDVLREYEDKLKNIEFIRYPIQRTKHQAVPINGPDPDCFCIPAVDAMFDFLKFLIFELRAFQRFKDWKPIGTMFLRLEANFFSDYPFPYFMNIKAVESARSVIYTHCAEWNEIPSKDIRTAKADGFTFQNLKHELAYLSLTKMFPEIQNHAEVVYAYVDKVKKEKVLRTCDLIDAVEYCQSICVLERLPKYKKFLHNQGACGRVPGLNCDLCVEIKKSATPTFNPVATYASVKSESHAKELEQLKIKISSLEAVNVQLKNEQSSEVSKLRNELKTEQEKSKKIEDDLVKKAKEILEIEVENIKLNAENEANKKVKEQLLEKFSKLSVGSC